MRVIKLKKKFVKENKVIIIILAASIILGIITYFSIPNQVPVHWSGGKVDRYAGKLTVSVLFPGILILMYFIDKISVSNPNVKKVYFGFYLVLAIQIVLSIFYITSY